MFWDESWIINYNNVMFGEFMPKILYVNWLDKACNQIYSPSPVEPETRTNRTIRLPSLLHLTLVLVVLCGIYFPPCCVVLVKCVSALLLLAVVLCDVVWWWCGGVGKVCYMGFCSTTSLQPVKSNSSVSRATDVTVCTVTNPGFKPGFIQPGI